MASNVQDVFMLFGDSITQGGWEPGLNALGQRLSRASDNNSWRSLSEKLGQMFTPGNWMY
jgi:hypothetical protein